MNALTEISGLPADPAVNGRWIFDRIEEWAKQGPQRPAFVLDHSDRLEEYTYADVLQFTDRIAAGLEARGIRRGDRVGILMENVPHWVFALLGVLRRIAAIAFRLGQFRWLGQAGFDPDSGL